LTGANSTPVLKAKEWRPRISVFRRLDQGISKNSQPAADRRSVFDRIQFNQSRANGGGNGMIPKKSVFDRLDFDLKRAEHAKNKDHQFKAVGENQATKVGRTVTFQISNNSSTWSSKSCVRCLRTGHWHHSCRFPITCHVCKEPGHIAANCCDPIRRGFQPRSQTIDCFQGKDAYKGKEIDVSGWFCGNNQYGPKSAPRLL
jgi:hypothetical protein